MMYERRYINMRSCAALLMVLGLTPITAAAQRAETPAERCAWEGWLPPTAGRARVRKSSPLDAAQEATLRADLRSPSKVRRQQAALRLGASQDQASIHALIAATDDLNSQVVDAAVRSLGRIGEREATSRVARLTASPNEHVRQGAVWALGQLQDPAGVDVVLAATREENKHVRNDATWALGLIGGNSAQARLVELTRDSSEHVRLAAVCSLAQMSTRLDPSARKAVSLLRSDAAPLVREVANWALDRGGR
jgi:HEAT repeat protein